MTSLIISNEKTNDIMKLIESPEDSDSLIRGVSETIQTEAKEHSGRCISISMLLGTLGASLSGNLWTGKYTIAADEGTIRAGQDF